MTNGNKYSKKNCYNIVILAFLVLITPFFISCGSGNPRNHPLYRKASLRLKEQKYEAAIELFESLLKKQPNAYAIHLELAKIYSEHGKDKIREFYHYRVYLDNTPPGQERSRIEQLYKLEQFEFAKDVVLKNRNLLKTSTIKAPDKVEKSANQLHQDYVQRLKNTLRSFVNQNRALAKKNKELTKQLSLIHKKLKNNKSNYTTLKQESLSSKNRYYKIRTEYQNLTLKNKALIKKLETLEKFLELMDKEAVATKKSKIDSEEISDNSITKNNKENIENDNKTEPKVYISKNNDKNNAHKTKKSFFHKVQAGDSLSSIAKKYYGNKSDAVKIMNANRLLLKNKDKLDVDMYLLIPKGKLYN